MLISKDDISYYSLLFSLLLLYGFTMCLVHVYLHVERVCRVLEEGPRQAVQESAEGLRTIHRQDNDTHNEGTCTLKFGHVVIASNCHSTEKTS